MKAYWALLSARFRMLLQYRAAAIAGFGTQAFWGIIRVMIFTAFYESSNIRQPMSRQDTITYIWLSQALFAMLPVWIDSELQNMIQQGNVAYELVRPLDLYALWYSRTMASRAAPPVLRALPLLLIAAFLGLKPPDSLSAAGAFLLSILSALLLSSAISMMIIVTSVWTIDARGIRDLATPVIWIFSGTILPLPLFPDWAQAVITVLPFRGLFDIPFRVYSGNIPLSEFPALLAFQLAWTLALIFAGRTILSMSIRRLVVQGG